MVFAVSKLGVPSEQFADEKVLGVIGFAELQRSWLHSFNPRDGVPKGKGEALFSRVRIQYRDDEGL